MENPMTIDEILDFAIKGEQSASDLYAGLAEKTKSPEAREMFLQFSSEEQGHKAKLMAVKGGSHQLDTQTAVPDLKISDYTVEEDLGDDPDYQSVLLFAMHKEKAAFRLYTDLAARAGDPEVSQLLLAIAQEEAKHKLRFEIEYDENVLTEN